MTTDSRSAWRSTRSAPRGSTSFTTAPALRAPSPRPSSRLRSLAGAASGPDHGAARLSWREAERCLARYIARDLDRLLEMVQLLDQPSERDTTRTRSSLHAAPQTRSGSQDSEQRVDVALGVGEEPGVVAPVGLD